MSYKCWQVGQSYGFWISTVRNLLKRVRADVYKSWEPYVIRDVSRSPRPIVFFDDARLNDHKEVIVDLKDIKLIFLGVLWRANLTPDVDSVLANKTKIRAFLHSEI